MLRSQTVCRNFALNNAGNLSSLASPHATPPSCALFHAVGRQQQTGKESEHNLWLHLTSMRNGKQVSEQIPAGFPPYPLHSCPLARAVSTCRISPLRINLMSRAKIYF